MKVIFRADASSKIGFGHVMRCLTLANALCERAVAVSFVCRQHEGHLCELIEERGFSVSRLSASVNATQSEDAEKTRLAIETSGIKPDWLIVDHYGLDQRWESALRTSVGRIMVIDDLANRRHDCDLLLDQNLVPQMLTRYTDNVPAACGFLLGPEYTLLQPAYAELHDRISPRKGPIQRLFIFFSGADGDNLTGRVLAAFLRLNRRDIEVDVVVTSDSPHIAAIHQQVRGYNNIHLHSDLPTLATLMVKADFAIGAGGATNWERLCLGLPTLVVTLSENQRPIAKELQDRGLIRWLGHHDEVDESVIGSAISELLQQGLNEEWSRQCLATIDGMGVSRVCAYLNHL